MSRDELHAQLIVQSKAERIATIVSGILANSEENNYFEDEDFAEEKNGPYIKRDGLYWMSKGAYVGTHKLVTSWEYRMVRYARKIEDLI